MYSQLIKFLQRHSLFLGLVTDMQAKEDDFQRCKFLFVFFETYGIIARRMSKVTIRFKLLRLVKNWHLKTKI